MKVYFFNIHMSHKEWLPFYEGAYHSILIRDDLGVKIQIPASKFRPFSSLLGIKGRFKLILNDDNSFHDLIRLA